MHAVQCEACAGGDVRDTVAVDVERLAETEAQLPAGYFGNNTPRYAPSLAWFRAAGVPERRLLCVGGRKGERAADQNSDEAGMRARSSATARPSPNR